MNAALLRLNPPYLAGISQGLAWSGADLSVWFVENFQSVFPNFPSCKQPATHLLWLPVNKTRSSCKIVEGHCAGPTVCPLSRVKAGTVVNVKHLALAPEMSDRLRELGLGEEQQVKLLSSETNVICLVCNARVALSGELAEAILVEPVVPKS